MSVPLPAFRRVRLTQQCVIHPQDKGGNWKDVCWPVTAEFRKQLNDALIDGYGQAIENLQATLEATKGAAEKPSLTGTLKENAGKVKEQPTKPAPSKNEQAR